MIKLLLFIFLSGCASKAYTDITPVTPTNTNVGSTAHEGTRLPNEFGMYASYATCYAVLKESSYSVWIDREVMHVSADGYIIFKSSDGVPVGTLDWSDATFKFYGDIEASATEFFYFFDNIYKRIYGAVIRKNGWRKRR